MATPSAASRADGGRVRVTTPSAATRPDGGRSTTYSQGNVFAEIIRQGGSLSEALVGSAIVMAESHGDPEATNLGGRVVGPWQIDLQAHPEVTVACAKNLACSTKAALKIKKQSRNTWIAWTTYKTGVYKKFVPDDAGKAFEKSLPEDLIDGLNSNTGVGRLPKINIDNPTAAIADAINVIGDFLRGLTDPKLWLRIGLIILGGLAVIIGIIYIGMIATRSPYGRAPTVAKAAGKVINR